MLPFLSGLDQTLAEVKTVFYKVEHLLGNKFRLSPIHYPSQVLAKGQEGLGML